MTKPAVYLLPRCKLVGKRVRAHLCDPWVSWMPGWWARVRRSRKNYLPFRQMGTRADQKRLMDVDARVRVSRVGNLGNSRHLIFYLGEHERVNWRSFLYKKILNMDIYPLYYNNEESSLWIFHIHNEINWWKMKIRYKMGTLTPCITTREVYLVDFSYQSTWKQASRVIYIKLYPTCHNMAEICINSRDINDFVGNEVNMLVSLGCLSLINSLIQE